MSDSGDIRKVSRQRLARFLDWAESEMDPNPASDKDAPTEPPSSVSDSPRSPTNKSPQQNNSPDAS